MPGLRVLAGTDLDNLVVIDELINSGKSHSLCSDIFDGQIVCNIQGFQDSSGNVLDSEYFHRPDRQGITWSIQVQGRFLKEYSSDDILFGNTFDRPLNLPWGSGVALKFMNYIDPTLEHDLGSKTQPWALSPLICTMPHFAYDHPPSTARPFPTNISLVDDTSQLHLALIPPSSPPSASSSSTSLSLSSNESSTSKKSRSISPDASDKRTHLKDPLNLSNASERQSHFSSSANRQHIVFGPDDVITTDFCYGFIEFSPSLCLRLPGGVTFDLMRYWDGQPVRFVCCERKTETDDRPWGRILWCIVVEPAGDA